MPSSGQTDQQQASDSSEALDLSKRNQAEEQVDLQALAKMVYRLLLDEVRVERERSGRKNARR